MHVRSLYNEMTLSSCTRLRTMAEVLAYSDKRLKYEEKGDSADMCTTRRG